MRPFSLSPRLRAVADLVPGGTRLVDVGTDHGRLPIWLIQHGVIDAAVATDLRSGPLDRARGAAERWRLTNQISFRLCDGLSAVRPDEAETVTVAGMGGETIAGILAASPWTAQPGRRYILQAMSGQDGLRRWLSDSGFAIRQEVLVPEGETLYVVLLAEYGPMAPLTDGECWVGRQAPDMDSPLRMGYLDSEYRKACRAVEGIAKSEAPLDRLRLPKYVGIRNELDAMRKEWAEWQA